VDLLRGVLSRELRRIPIVSTFKQHFEADLFQLSYAHI